MKNDHIKRTRRERISYRDDDRVVMTRFCSREEAEMLRQGRTIHNDRDHYRGGGGSLSLGFCFTELSPQKAWSFLKGIVDADVVMQIRIPLSKLTKSQGKYRDDGKWYPGDYRNPNFPGIVLRREWCTETLDPSQFRILSIHTLEELFDRKEVEAHRIVRRMIRAVKRQGARIEN